MCQLTSTAQYPTVRRLDYCHYYIITLLYNGKLQIANAIHLSRFVNQQEDNYELARIMTIRYY